MDEKKKYRLVTRSDFDGLASAVLLKELDLIETIKFVHPKDVQDGKVEIGPNDITTNLPYMENALLVFDHHASEAQRVGQRNPNHVIIPNAPSAARVVYEYYGGASTFTRVAPDMMTAVDKADSAQFSMDEVMNPRGWVLLNFLMDARTGLGRFKEFRVSNYDLMMALIDACRSLSIEQILELPDVKERVDLYNELHDQFKNQLTHCTTVHGKVALVDLRNEEIIFPGNRFMVYALFPQCSLSMHVLWGLQKQNTSFAVGKSIFDRSAPLDIGALMLQYGGGGHTAAGTCQIENDKAEAIKTELIEKLKAGA